MIAVHTGRQRLACCKFAGACRYGRGEWNITDAQHVCMHITGPHRLTPLLWRFARAAAAAPPPLRSAAIEAPPAAWRGVEPTQIDSRSVQDSGPLRQRAPRSSAADRREEHSGERLSPRTLPAFDAYSGGITHESRSDADVHANEGDAGGVPEARGAGNWRRRGSARGSWSAAAPEFRFPPQSPASPAQAPHPESTGARGMDLLQERVGRAGEPWRGRMFSEDAGPDRASDRSGESRGSNGSGTVGSRASDEQPPTAHFFIPWQQAEPARAADDTTDAQPDARSGADTGGGGAVRSSRPPQPATGRYAASQRAPRFEAGAAAPAVMERNTTAPPLRRAQSDPTHGSLLRCASS